MNNTYEIVKYDDSFADAWDSFVMENSVNGTFLQTRRFLSYHPAERFTDNSYLVLDGKGNLSAVCPACIDTSDGFKTLYSHKGSTFGGFVISKRMYKNASKVIELVQLLEDKARVDGFEKIVLKITPSLFSSESPDLLEYILYYMGYREYDELNLYIDYSNYKENVTGNYEQGKRTHVNKCLRAGMEIKELETDSEIATFYKLLCSTLQKYDLKPVHSLNELLDFRNNRLTDECGFWGAFLGNEMLAGSMMFYFRNIGVAHAQYISAAPDYNKLSPSTFMYHAMIEKMKEMGFGKISFGISSEHLGKVLNFGLTSSKEAYGSRHTVNRIFSKNLKQNTCIQECPDKIETRASIIKDASDEKRKKLVIVGTGEFGEIAYEYFTYDSDYEVVGFSVEKKYLMEKELRGKPVVPFEDIEQYYPNSNYELFVAITYPKLNRIRTRVYTAGKKKGYSFASYVSSKAFVWHNVLVGENTFIFEDNTIQYNAQIGNNVILWSGNHIGHRSVIEDNCWITSHVVISGFCHIGKNCFIGVNVSVGDNVSIAADVVLGAGSVTVKDLPLKGQVYLGSPAKSINRTSYEQFGMEINEI